jgi:hypothetical protein
MRRGFATCIVVTVALVGAATTANAAPRDNCIPPPKQTAGHHSLCQFILYCRLAGVNAPRKARRQCIVDRIHWRVFIKKGVGAYVHYHSKPNERAKRELQAFKYDRRHHRPTA